MESFVICPDCRAEHAEPAEANLGHLVVCAECALTRELILAVELLPGRPVAVAA